MAQKRKLGFTPADHPMSILVQIWFRAAKVDNLLDFVGTLEIRPQPIQGIYDIVFFLPRAVLLCANSCCVIEQCQK